MASPNGFRFAKAGRRGLQPLGRDLWGGEIGQGFASRKEGSVMTPSVLFFHFFFGIPKTMHWFLFKPLFQRTLEKDHCFPKGFKEWLMWSLWGAEVHPVHAFSGDWMSWDRRPGAGPAGELVCQNPHPHGYGSKRKPLGTTGFGLFFLLPIGVFGYPFFDPMPHSHFSHVLMKERHDIVTFWILLSAVWPFVSFAKDCGGTRYQWNGPERLPEFGASERCWRLGTKCRTHAFLFSEIVVPF